MSFTPGIPTTGQSLGVTKFPIQQNFTAINDTISVNHVAMNDADQGKHKFLQMPSQGSAAPPTASAEMGLYVKGDPGAARMFIRQESSGQEVQFSGINPLIVKTAGYTWLPGGLLAQWKTVGTTSSLSTVTFPTSYDSDAYFVLPIQIDTSSPSSARALSVVSVDANGFSIRITTLGSNPSDSSAKFWFLAVGPKA